MPELPEVETVRRSLAPHLLGRTIAAATLRRDDFVTGARTPADLLQGATVERIERRGKQLAVIAASGRAVIVQLGMSGQVLAAPASSPLPTHVHALWTIRSSSTTILFRDPRRFGGLTTLRSPAQLEATWQHLGPDGLAITAAQLWSALHSSSRAIKAALLDQHTVAGIGNIYADEALFVAGIHPKALCHRLSHSRVERLAHSIRQVLTTAVAARGSTLRDYRDADGQAGSYANLHRVYGRAGLVCTVCGQTLRGFVLGQRTTVACSTCQAR
ncbi:MAG: bifunctional DNA-formamidopyrimidine glycosylase/DNA-(apurinic or apyrimidinic site) lyase [Phycisphaerales bacterium]|nr:bifunctional DNA-formamidopyrimidine glycosylase/DNA-(apurinic or apyrimidinic site) lyase [Phycisphaerales bacterium]